MAREGRENAEDRSFWLDLMQNVLEVPDALSKAEFQHPVRTGASRHPGFADVWCQDARFLVEQKSIGVDLDRPEDRQGTMVTPLEQALRYARSFRPSVAPTVICVCNFERFRLYDLEADPTAGSPTAEFTLEELPENIGTLAGVFGEERSVIRTQQRLSEKAGRLVAALHNAVAGLYGDPDEPGAHHSLAVLTVRLVFCMYAEDSGLFRQNAFSNLMAKGDATQMRRNLLDLFRILNTPDAERDRYEDPDLLAFPYVNGGLYAEKIEVPRFDESIRKALLDASESFNWTGISSVIFGSLMEETLSHDQRRTGGMHYTTVRNIHRVIDPLFLDGLTAELDRIEATPSKTTAKGELTKAYRDKLTAYQDKLASIRCLENKYLSLLQFNDCPLRDVA